MDKVLDILKTENLLAGSDILDQISSLRKSLCYTSEGESISFDDYYLKLQNDVDNLPSIQLQNTISPNTEAEYSVQLITALETVIDAVDRVGNKLLHYQSKIKNAQLEIQNLEATFVVWYTVSALDKGFKLTAKMAGDLAKGEFFRLMGGITAEIDSLLEALKVQAARVKTHKLNQREKYNLGKEQINAVWTSSLPNMGMTSDRNAHKLEEIETEFEEEDDDIPAYISKKPQIASKEEEKEEGVELLSAKKGFYKVGDPQPARKVENLTVTEFTELLTGQK